MSTIDPTAEPIATGPTAPPDLSALRERFPALRREIDGRTCLFADAPGGTQVPDTVISAMAEYLRTSNANTHGTFATSEETDETIREARRAGADLLGCEPDEIVFGQNATTLLLHLSRSIGRKLGPQDEIVVTVLDHDANVAPWLLLAEDTGATIRWVDLREEDATLDVDSFDAALSGRTRVAAFTVASNAVGSVTPAADLASRARAAGALVVMDAVHAAQHRSLDVRALQADLLVCSPYKFFGPHLGMLFGRRQLLADLRPYKVRASPDEVPERWETGTLNHEGLAGLIAAIDYLADVGRRFGAPSGASRRAELVAGFGAIGRHEADLSVRFLEGIRDLPNVRLWGISDPARVAERTATFAVRVGEQHPLDTSRALGGRGVFVWEGHYYALAIMDRLGLLDSGGAVRIGFCHYNTRGEVDRVLTELADLQRTA